MSNLDNKPIAAAESDEALVDALFAKRESIDINPNNARFFPSEGGLVSMELTSKNGDKEFFERIIILRTYPVTNPDEFLSVRTPDSRSSGKGVEIGIVKNINDFPKEQVNLVNEELDRRYFIPQITHVYSIKEKHGRSYWDTETTSGRRTFMVNNPYSDIHMLEDGRLLVEDIDGSNYTINGLDSLDKFSQKKVESFF